MIVTLSDVKSYLGISGTEKDAFLNLQIEIITEAIENYCRRKFTATDYVEEFYYARAPLFPRNQLSLHHYPIIEVHGIVSVWTVNGIESQLDVPGFRVHKATGRILDFNNGVIYTGSTDHIRISYRAGYEPADMPATLKNVVLSLVQEAYNKSNMGVDLNFGSDVKRVSIPGTIGIDFDYSGVNAERGSAFGSILGKHLNVLDFYRSDRAVMPEGILRYVEEVP